jgi:hypothetical protein
MIPPGSRRQNAVAGGRPHECPGLYLSWPFDEEPKLGLVGVVGGLGLEEGVFPSLNCVENPVAQRAEGADGVEKKPPASAPRSSWFRANARWVLRKVQGETSPSSSLSPVFTARNPSSIF